MNRSLISPMAELDVLGTQCEHLRLTRVAQTLPSLLEQAAQQELIYSAFLQSVLETEVAAKLEQHQAMRVQMARFVSADVLIGELSHAASLGTLDTALTPYLQPHVLVLDEIGYLAHVADAANVLYRVVNERYLRQLPIPVTTNKPLAAWGHVLHDGDLAEAILDRLLERGTHFEMRGRSYRTRHLKATERVDAPDA